MNTKIPSRPDASPKTLRLSSGKVKPPVFRTVAALLKTLQIISENLDSISLDKPYIHLQVLMDTRIRDRHSFRNSLLETSGDPTELLRIENLPKVQARLGGLPKNQRIHYDMLKSLLLEILSGKGTIK